MNDDKPISEDELKAMEEDLDKSAPAAVKRELPSSAQPKQAVEKELNSTEIAMGELEDMSETAPERRPTAKSVPTVSG